MLFRSGMSLCGRSRMRFLLIAFLAVVCTGQNDDDDDVCMLCPNGEDFSFPDAKIPYFPLPGNDNPTCADLANEAATISANQTLCKKYQANAGFCGCPGIIPTNVCTFCPDGGMPSRSNVSPLSSGHTCRDLVSYVSFFDEEQCNSIQYQAISGDAKYCGCTSLEDSPRNNNVCTFCPDGSFPPIPDLDLELAGMTCGEYAIFVNGLSQAECQIQSARGTFDLFAFQCGCSGAIPPVCTRQENPELCTVSLLRTVTDDVQCECYSFCDEEFVGCDSYPGHFLGSSCLGEAVSGCNLRSAVDDSGICHICPDFTNNITQPDAVLPPFSGVFIPGVENATCQDLIDYIEQPDNTDLDCSVVRNRLAYYCGCESAEPSCTLCPGGVEPSYKDKIATGDITCGDFANTVLTWERDTCNIGDPYLDVMAARCGCITADYPVCPINQNPWLCTMNLLRSTNETCACYNFCGNEFHSCSEHPGQSLTEEVCPEGQTLIAGCNRALAMSSRYSRGSIGPRFHESELKSAERSSLRRGR